LCSSPSLVLLGCKCVSFLHGRTMTAISTKERVLARSLARRTVEALILATRAGQITSREDFLDGLLDKGAPLI